MRSPIIPLVVLAGLAACDTYSMDRDEALPPPAAQTAYARLMTAGDEMVGRAMFAETAAGVEVDVRLEGLEPGSTHGVHVHKRGDCSAPDFSSAGGHWNPTDQPHPNHLGDLGNVTIGADGTATLDAVIAGASLAGGSPELIDGNGAALIVHAHADDLTSQPSGDAGARLACSVIALG